MSGKTDKAKRPIIIIKKKGGHAAAHGGSWKVAYADFVTAMMAFFLLMWLLSMSSPETKKALADYFNEFTLFEKGGTALMEKGGPPGPESFITAMSPPDGRESGSTSGDKAGIDEFVKRLKLEIEAQLNDLKDLVILDKFERGVRLELVETAGQPLFASGSAVLSPAGVRIFSVVGKTLNSIDNKIAIEGHTDARGYASRTQTNWDLSTDRASTARRELVKNGLSEARLDHVAGYGATVPYVKSDPFDARNRRISVLIYEKPGRTDGQGLIEGLTGSGPDGAPAGPAAQPDAPDPMEQRIQRVYEETRRAY